MPIQKLAYWVLLVWQGAVGSAPRPRTAENVVRRSNAAKPAQFELVEATRPGGVTRCFGTMWRTTAVLANDCAGTKAMVISRQAATTPARRRPERAIGMDCPPLWSAGP